jgi:hypothetical protein
VHNICLLALFINLIQLKFRFSNCGAFYTENMILSYERVILLALHRMFGPEYFSPSGLPIIYCTPDPVLISTIKRTALQVIRILSINKLFIYKCSIY